MRALVLTGVLAGLAALFLPAPRAAAQGRAVSDRPVDRIVAIVGTKPILASQVEEQLVLAQSQGVKMPEDSAGRDAARRQVLSQMVDEELLVQQAERDTTIKVTDQEVQDAVEQTVQNVRKQFTSIPEFQTQLRAAGFVSEEEWRRWLADQQRRAILQQRLIEGLKQKGKLWPIPPSDAEMRAFWESNREQQAKRPAAISFRQIVIVPKPDSAASVRALQLAEGDGGRPLGLLLPVRLPERPHLGVRRRNRPQFPLLLESLDQPLLQDRATLLVGEPATPFLFGHEPGRAKLRLELRDRGELLAHVLDGLLDRVLHFLVRHLDRGVALRLLHQQLLVHHLRGIWRRAASRPAESAGTFAPCDCARTSCSSTCDARIGFVPTTATMRSKGRSVAARPCAAAGVPQGETAASTATTMIRTRARMSA